MSVCLLIKLAFSLKQQWLNTSHQLGDGCMDDCGKDCVFSVINTINTSYDLVFCSRKYNILAYKLHGV